MQSNRFLIFQLLTAIFIATGLSAQHASVDFSGKWYLQKDRSEPSDIGGRTASLKLVVVQEQDEMAIDRTYNSFAVYETLTFDGAESPSEFRSSPRLAKVDWATDRQSLTVSAKTIFRRRGSEFEVVTSEQWMLSDDGQTLSIDYTSTSPRREMQATLVYTKDEPTGPREYIPPNLNFYSLHPGRKAKSLGWAEERVEEDLGRGMLAIANKEGQIYLGWRLRKQDPADIAFNLYRQSAGDKAIKLNTEPIDKTTDFVDVAAALDRENTWWVRPIIAGQEQQIEATASATLPANAPPRQYISIKLRDDLPEDGIHKIGIGDLDGDGEYDFVVKRPRGRVDPGIPRPSPDTFKVEAYTQDGTWLWRNDLGWSIELGTWTSPMIVYDFNGDGKAEVALKTGEGDPRGADDRILTGPEYCSIWNGETGAEIAKVDWIARGKTSDWGDDVGNRMNRNMLGVAYLDGKTPSLLVLRGIYGLMKVDAWFLQDAQPQKAWSWTNESAGWKYQGQGQHSIHIADIDGDGRDEILNGSLAIDNDGRTMWSTGLGHGDRFYVTDINPARPGMEVWYSYEDPHPQNGVSLWDAHTGNLIFGTDSETLDNEIDRALVGDIDPAHPGMELWADRFFYTAAGEAIPGEIPPLDGLVWWDADALRELQTRGGVSKWQGPTLTNDIEGNVMAWADILGDWREEIITYVDGELRIYTTVIPAADRRVCLMQDPLYRIDVALKSMGYDQIPMTSYYLGSD
jgi:rhamnogalacturonan endolyase